MRAVVVNEVGNKDSVRVEEVPEPSPGPDEVLIEVASVSLNFPDLLMLDGKYQIRPDPPYVLGKDLAGDVLAVGAAVKGIAPGDRIMGYVHYGAFAERVSVPASQCFAVPDDVDFAAATAMGVTFQTAYAALVERAALKAGETVLITGASGGVGLATISLAKALGAATVIAGLTTLAKAESVREAGADHVIDLSGEDLRDSVRDQVGAATGRKEVDVVIDVLGGDVFDACLRALGWCGRIVVLGFMAGRIPEVKTNYLLIKNIAVIGSSVNSYYERGPELMTKAQEVMFDLYRQGRIKPHIMATFPLEGISSALDLFAQRKVVGKVMLHTGRD